APTGRNSTPPSGEGNPELVLGLERERAANAGWVAAPSGSRMRASGHAKPKTSPMPAARQRDIVILCKGRNGLKLRKIRRGRCLRKILGSEEATMKSLSFPVTMLVVTLGTPGLSPASAQERCAMSWETPASNTTYTQQQVIDVGDVPGHQIRIFELKRTF